MSKRYLFRSLLIATSIWIGTETVSAQEQTFSFGNDFQLPSGGFEPPMYYASSPLYQEDAVVGQDSGTVGSGVKEGAAEGQADDLDSLLDMADKDVGNLSSVKVAQNASAPSLQTEVSTVGRQKSTVGRSPAAVFVISNEMIQRSGARTIPDVLRMAPGVQVSRIDANKWAISIRGSSGQFANKLLVQIDGRVVYTPLFAGVFWDVQDVLLEDVERN